ncbi:hypothetical protein JRI60_01390 [Archangium violaceum]|uniref:hypothetical protein n=1 Tax=Archangium violaceum TaxID=83451 RepID=UPI00194F0257|nr:hypothetical protein [Archangium violaceum]QRN97769.1 hypothetical protein JRI60_01390 [Archangium violaceum]
MSSRSLHGSRLALAVGLILMPVLVLAQAPESSKQFELTPDLVLWMYGMGIAAISIAWVLIAWLFARNKALGDLVDLVKRGPLIKFVTVTYIIIVIVTLSLVGQLESSHVSTLLGAIAGYVLGDRGREDRVVENRCPEPQPSRAGAPPPPSAPTQASEGQHPPSEFHS